jgi:NAD(P)-dependent dehydrogenase (short-subunit alcohol dehydrogenase family)
MNRLRTLLDMNGRVALVTGAAGHLGRVIAETLVEQGCFVVLSDRAGTPGPAVADALNGAAGREAAAFVPCDLLDEGDSRALVSRAVALRDRLDVLVHNAAYTGTSQVQGWAEPFGRQGVTAFDTALRVNTTSAFILAQEAAPHLAASGHGAVLLVASIYGFLAPQWSLYEGTAMVNPAGYNVSKAGLIQLGRYLATTLPPVRVNVISPGGIARSQPEAFVRRYAARTPLARMAVEDDFRGAVAFLASDASAYVTGHNLVVDGGWSAW